MGLLRRIFSSEYRRALAAEAEGNYLAAARSYALCGEGGKVVQMHLAQARMEPSLVARIDRLRAALEAATSARDDRRPEVLRQLAEKLTQHAEQLDTATTTGQQALIEAAALYEEAEIWEHAGDCHLRLGDRNRAASAYAKAGQPDRVEELLTLEEQARQRRRTAEDRFQDYQMLLQGGQRDEAARALRDCAAAASQPCDYQRLLEDLEAHLLSAGRVTLNLDRQRVILVGHFPLYVGRDADCDLSVRGTSISRRHASIDWDAKRGDFMITDEGSYNGTLLNGLKLAATMPLPPSGILQLGSGCTLEFVVLGEPPDCLSVTIGMSLDQGTRLLASPSPMDLSRLIKEGPELIISFDNGRPLARSTSGELLLNGSRIAEQIQLIVDDELRLDQRRITVLD